MWTGEGIQNEESRDWVYGANEDKKGEESNKGNGIEHWISSKES